jgi:hypothetical protein
MEVFLVTLLLIMAFLIGAVLYDPTNKFTKDKNEVWLMYSVHDIQERSITDQELLVLLSPSNRTLVFHNKRTTRYHQYNVLKLTYNRKAIVMYCELMGASKEIGADHELWVVIEAQGKDGMVTANIRTGSRWYSHAEPYLKMKGIDNTKNVDYYPKSVIKEVNHAIKMTENANPATR